MVRVKPAIMVLNVFVLSVLVSGTFSSVRAQGSGKSQSTAVQPTCPQQNETNPSLFTPILAGDQTTVTICADPIAQVVLQVDGEKAADAVLIGEFGTDMIDLSQVRR
jgi:hypothetical protein